VIAGSWRSIDKTVPYRFWIIVHLWKQGFLCGRTQLCDNNQFLTVTWAAASTAVHSYKKQNPENEASAAKPENCFSTLPLYLSITKRPDDDQVKPNRHKKTAKLHENPTGKYNHLLVQVVQLR